MGKKFITLFSIALIIIISITVFVHIETTHPDPELNRKMYIGRSNYNHGGEYIEHYKSLFDKLNYQHNFSMSLDWLVLSYEDVYTHKEDAFYTADFVSKTKSGEKSAEDLLILYNSDNEKYYYFKPFLDCYLLMNKDHKPSKEELEIIKGTILYALDYYINGKDFVGTLE